MEPSIEMHPGYQLAYLKAGNTGPPLLFLHGWAAFKELWWHSLHELATAHRCFAPDLPGHGGSPLADSTTIAAMARRMFGFCTDLGVERFGLVGHSMGGCIAAMMALQQPERIERLVLVDPAIDAYKLPRFVRFYLFKHYGWAILRLNLALAQHLRPLTQRIPHDHGGGWLRPWLRRSAYSAIQDPDAMRLTLNALMHARVGKRLARLRMPTLVISGQFDSLVPAAHSAAVAQAIPGARYMLIQGALHNPMDERPQRFVQVLTRFLAEQ